MNQAPIETLFKRLCDTKYSSKTCEKAQNVVEWKREQEENGH